jgi:ribonuclease P protein component
MKYTFPRRSRLTKETQFKQVYKARQKIPTEIFTIYYCKNNFSCPRLGVIVPKKNVRESSKRNCFKRLIRENFRLNQHRFKNIDIVVFVNNKANALAEKELKMFLAKQLNQLVV